MKKHLLEQFTNTVRMCGAQFGDSCQVILYDLRVTEGEKVGTAMAVSGRVTDTQVGAPLPAFLLHYATRHGLQDDYGFINKNYPGLVLRTSLQFIHDETGLVAGCLCIHHNIVHIQMIISFLEEYTRSQIAEDEDESLNISPGSKEYKATDIQSFMDSVMQEFLIERLGQNSFANLDKNDKLALISELESKGVFLVKGSVNLVANRMNISKFSIYNYLEEIRTKKTD